MVTMEVEKKCSNNISKEEDDNVPLPGFRFHPTDEELVGFYLRRKVEKKPISIELIKQADIYKYDPWDLPKSSTNVGDREWYFFCKRGRKYKNSVRPNRVTGSGFWKATGIDKAIYPTEGEGRQCIGLKKSLVYYRGSAGKGTKTEWMMHEFRLPPKNTADQEAEVWTLCRILKRDVSYKKYLPDWRKLGTKKVNSKINYINPVATDHASSETCSVESCSQNRQSNYISFNKDDQNKPYSAGYVESNTNQHFLGHFGTSVVSQAPSAPSSYPSYIFGDIYGEVLRNGDWEDLRSIVDFSAGITSNNDNINPF
ncbi:hypothetical protein CDL12_17637 [Handroanthus impetiginosus]|uniref:NAC domain-containing protein n=1 Tax=Handroanthus impetiginosus TaxID=429701 RepID=A0A2G9GWX3_9LAMI|nr:hypothetical protein CDL12_17637 [Handroanthus impetiginosus]